MSRKYRARCNICSWKSQKKHGGPVFAGWDGLRHVKEKHADAEGIVVVIEKVENGGDEQK